MYCTRHPAGIFAAVHMIVNCLPRSDKLDRCLCLHHSPVMISRLIILQPFSFHDVSYLYIVEDIEIDFFFGTIHFLVLGLQLAVTNLKHEFCRICNMVRR